jgi:tRNA (Thr-GGU) A37 N-methylase
VKVSTMTQDTLQVAPIESIDAPPVVDIKPVLSESADW